MRLKMIAVMMLAATAAGHAQAPQPVGLEAALAYPFLHDLTAAERSDRVAWVRTVKGVRNVWTAAVPAYRAIPLTHATADDGQELTGLVLSPDGKRAAWTRGGDHDANWQAEGGLQPNRPPTRSSRSSRSGPP